MSTIEYMVEAAKRIGEPGLARLRGYRVLIGTPCFGGQLSVHYVESINRTCRVFDALGLSFDIRYIARESLIQRARNTLMAEMDNKGYTHLMFIDADIGFSPVSIIRMLYADVGVIAGVYPLKFYHWGAITQYIRSRCDDRITEGELLFANQPMVFNRIKDEPITDGMARVNEVGTGFMLIERGVMQRMKEVCAKYKNNVQGYDDMAGNGAEFYNYFEVGVGKNGLLLSEDYKFCERCRELGISVWVDTRVTLTHTGPHTFRGNLDYAIRNR